MIESCRRGACAAALGVLLLGGPPAAAQVTAGGDIARHVALGGGGVALADREASAIINPAVLAVPVGFRLRFSRLGYGGQGEVTQEAWRLLIRTKDLDSLETLGLDLARSRNRMWTENGVGLRVGRWHLDLAGSGQLEGIPNAPLMRWVRQGAAFYPPPDARFTAHQGYFVIPSIGYGQRWKLDGGRDGALDAGLRLKYWVGRYRQVRARGVPDGSGFDIVTREVADVQTSDFGVDLGLRFSPGGNRDLSYGLVVLGLVEPSLGRMRQERTFNAGAALRVNSRVTVVMDLLNLTSANHRALKFTTGAEYRPGPRWLTLRGAVTTRGLAGGVGIGPLQIAFSRDGETTLGTQIRF